MCTGMELALLAAGTALSGGGAYLSNKEANENAAAMTRARNDELALTLAKNRELADRSRKVYDERMADSTAERFGERQEDLTDRRTDTLTSAVQGVDADSVPISGSAPTVVKSEIAKKLLGATKSAKESAKALGTLGGYGDLWFDQGLQDASAGRDIGVLSNFQQGNMGILPYSQDFAQYAAYRPSSGLGDMMQAAGSVIGGYAGSGKLAGKGFMPAKTSGPFPVPMA